MTPMRIGGLASGMDIDALVEKLMMAERVPLDKLEQKKQTYEWQRDAYRDVNKKLQTFDTYIADNLILKSFNTKTATSSNTAYVTAKATSSASGTLIIEGVSQLATAARATGTQVNATSSSKLSAVGISGTGYFELSAIKSDGTLATEATKIEYDANMSVSQLISKINSSSAGVNALFENGTLSISAKNTGNNKNGAEIQLVNDSQGIFSKLGLSVGGDGTIANNGTNAIFQVNGIATERSTNTFSISGYSVTLKETFNVSKTIDNKLAAAQTEQQNAYASVYGGLDASGHNIAIGLEQAANNANDAYDAVKGDYTDKLADVLGSSNLNETEQIAYDNFKNKSFLSKLSDTDIEQLAKFSIVDPNASEMDIKAMISTALDDEISPDLKDKLHSLSKEQLIELSNLNQNVGTIEEKENQLKNLQIEATRDIKQDNYNVLSKTFLKDLSAEDIKTITSIDFTQENPLDGVGGSLAEELGKLLPAQKNALDNLSEGELADFQALATVQIPHDEALAAKNVAKNAFEAGKKRLENAEATLTAAQAAKTAETTNPSTAPNISPVSMTSTTNVDEMMNKIKDFVKTYNDLIKELNDKTKESKYRDYKPLTSMQREEMEEKEIELWEEKAKSGLLRSDTIIRNGLSSMRGLIYESNPAVSNTKFNTLFSVGITTSRNYNEGGTLEIDEEKLRAALEEDPDAVTTLFNNSSGKKKDTILVDGVQKEVDTRGYLEKLREAMTTVKINIEKKAGRATMTDNQYSIGKLMKDVENRVDAWKTKLQDIEARYWRQFTAMEQAINKANQQSTLFMPQM